MCDYCVLHKCSIGGASFVQTAVGLNFAVTGIRSFQDVIVSTSKRASERTQIKIALCLSKHPQGEEIVSKSMQVVKNDIASHYAKWFRRYKRASFICGLVGVLLLYFNYADPKNLFLAMIWPVFYVHVPVYAAWKSEKICSQAKNYANLQHLFAKTSLNDKSVIDNISSALDSQDE